MPALKPTDYTAVVTWLGCVNDRETSLRAVAREAVQLTYAGVPGESHGGLTRPACSRVSAQHPEGTEIRNERQLSILSADELALVAADMGLDALNPSWLGASLVIEGIPDFTYVPPGSRLQGPDGVTLVVDMENRPCIYPGKVIEEERPGFGRAFLSAAKNRRGVTGWVQREGSLRIGDTLRLHTPDQRAWQPEMKTMQAAG
ncbi:MOSC domain-containing protein [Pseudohalocynthiibacter aestuariivivens]|nr:MOSC domain-containing protein [Pseudohalocynthiibacter aestuariivivens]QIE46751.1 MOSC domain-containing protein [Pseudohalocynthiibacter aestuariivivens]